MVEKREAVISIVEPFREAWQAAVRRPLNTLLTAVGIAIATAMIVAITGMSRSAADEVAGQFEKLKATSMTLSYSDKVPAKYVSVDRQTRIQSLIGVRSAGLVMESQNAKVPLTGGTAGVVTTGKVLAMTSGAEQAKSLAVISGRLFDSGHVARADSVALIGALLAKQIFPQGAAAGNLNVMMQIAGRYVLVMGVVDSTDPIVASSIIVPLGWEKRIANSTSFGKPYWLLGISAGSGPQLLEDAPVALLPEMPDGLTVALGFDAATLRGQVTSTGRTLVLTLGVLAALIGAMVIRNSLRIAVLQRRSEVGLRRALGYSRASVVLQFIAEGGVVGFFGAALGVVLGTAIAVIYPLALGQVPNPPWLLVVSAAPCAAMIGILASLGPASAASRVDPVETLRA